MRSAWRASSPSGAAIRRTMAAMGTVVAILASGRGAAAAIREAVWVVGRLERRWSRFRPDSEVARLNASPGEWVRVGFETEDLLRRAIELAEVTGGAFDITVGSPAGADRRLEHAANGRFRLAPGTRVDLGGIGKGAAAEQVIAILRQHGVDAAVANFGQSSLALLGRPADRGAWRIGIRPPGDPAAQVCRTIVLAGGYVSTSGDYEASSASGNHIIDPRTGWPADTGVRSATVVCDDGARAEALSTALVVLGVEAGLQLHARVGGFEAVLIGPDSEVTCTPGVARASRVSAA